MKKFITLKSIILFVFVVVIVLGYIYKGLFIAATVNGSPISRFSVIGLLEKESGKMVLDNLISEKLILNEAKNRNITVSQEEIDTVLKNIESQVKIQGQTLDQALVTQNMSKEDLIKQITIQKKLESMLSDKIQIAAEEIDKFIKDNKITTPKDLKQEDFRKNIENQLRQQKLGMEVNTFVTGLREKASIGRFVNY
ncbi:MAG: SurA N-terminal domain-containing protein [bacterium]|nr:SurA N-terminal domain-containing protein [bacterium]